MRIYDRKKTLRELHYKRKLFLHHKFLPVKKWVLNYGF